MTAAEAQGELIVSFGKPFKNTIYEPTFSGLNTTTALGNGALFLCPPNFNRPLTNVTSPR